MVTKDEVLNTKNSHFIDNSGHIWRRNGQVKTWKRNTDKFSLPIKHGLYAYGYITEQNASQFSVKR